jgi:hypothetical protein
VAQISENALVMSIQAIHQLLEQARLARDAASGSEQADFDEVIEANEIAAMELREANKAALAEGADLPPYDDFISQ